MTTPENIENYLLITIDEAYKPVVQTYIDAVTAYIERYTGRKFTVDGAASARVYDGDGTNEIYIDDASEITKVEVSYGVGSDFTEIPDYYTYPGNTKPITKIILPYNYFYEGNQNVRVTAKWGYGEDVPDDLAFAATVIAAGIVNYQDSDDKDIQSETIGRYSVTYKSNSPQEHDFSNAKAILKTYKRYA